MSDCESIETESNGVYHLINLKACKKRSAYLEAADYDFCLLILGKRLGAGGPVSVIAYCLQPDGCRLLVRADGALNNHLNRVIADYNHYAQIKYRRPMLTENYDHYRVADGDLLDGSCRVHLAAGNWPDHEYSSIRAYFYDDAPLWLDKHPIVERYGSAIEYFKLMRRLSEAAAVAPIK